MKNRGEFGNHEQDEEKRDQKRRKVGGDDQEPETSARLIPNPAAGHLHNYYQQLVIFTQEYLKHPAENQALAAEFLKTLEEKSSHGIKILNDYVEYVLGLCAKNWHGSIDTTERFYAGVLKIHDEILAQNLQVIHDSDSIIERFRVALAQAQRQGMNNGTLLLEYQGQMMESLKMAFQQMLPQLTQGNGQAPNFGQPTQSRPTFFKKANVADGHEAYKVSLRDLLFTQDQLDFLKALSDRLVQALIDKDQTLVKNLCQATMNMLTSEDKVTVSCKGIDIDDVEIPETLLGTVDPEGSVRYAHLIVRDVFNNEPLAKFLEAAYQKLNVQRVESVDDSKEQPSLK